MPVVNSTPSGVWQAALLTLANGGVNKSASVYVSVNNTSGWEIQIPVQIRFSNVSADPVVSVYRSMDGGATYDTVPLTSFSIARVPGSNQQGSITLPTGQYLLQLLNSGPYSASFAVNTQFQINQVTNV